MRSNQSPSLPGGGWKSIYVNRFNKKYVHNNMLRARIEYYRSAKKWNSYVKYFIRQEYQNGIETWTKG
jgi:hypothetical protein